MTKSILPDMTNEKEQHLAFLYLAKEEFGEAIRFAGALQKKEHVIDGGEHASPVAKALDLALVITYARPFKKNYGYGTVSPLLDIAMRQFTADQRELHERIITARDEEYAHADAEVNDIQVYFDEMFTFSKCVTREPLQHFEINRLIEMCRTLTTSIDQQIQELRSVLTNQQR